MIYAAASRALCALEILAGSRELARDYISVPIEIPDDFPLRSLSIDDLPENWNSPQHPESTRELGTDWAQSKATAILVVPSAVLPREHNDLINPLHPDFLRIVFHPSETFAFDERLQAPSVIRADPGYRLEMVQRGEVPDDDSNRYRTRPKTV